MVVGPWLCVVFAACWDDVAYLSMLVDASSSPPFLWSWAPGCVCCLLLVGMTWLICRCWWVAHIRPLSVVVGLWLCVLCVAYYNDVAYLCLAVCVVCCFLE